MFFLYILLYYFILCSCLPHLVSTTLPQNFEKYIKLIPILPIKYERSRLNRFKRDKSVILEDSKTFENIREELDPLEDKKKEDSSLFDMKQRHSLNQIKNLASELMVKINNLTKVMSEHKDFDSALYKNNNVKRKCKRKRRKNKKMIRHRRRKQKNHLRNAFGSNQSKWGSWTDWSACSVTCGKGREIRWRHCIWDNCYGVETEMEEKSCQLPACSPTKLFGLFG